MRIRHLALVATGTLIAALLVYALAPSPSSTPQVLDDGTISLTASEDGVGAWVPYTITVRNLGDHDFSGRLLMVKRLEVKPGVQARLRPVTGISGVVSPLATTSQVPPPDGAYQFPVAISPRHKKTFTFFAPPTFTQVVVEDGRGNRVAKDQVDEHKSIAVGALTELPVIVNDLQAIRIGDLTARITLWDAARPFPDSAVRLSGYSAVVIDRYDTARLSRPQLQALADFVALGGELVLAGAADLARTAGGLPPELVPLLPSGDTILERLSPVAQLSGQQSEVQSAVVGGTPARNARVILDAADGRPLMAELAFGAGTVVEMTFDPQAAGLATMAFTQAIARGLNNLRVETPRGRTLIDTSALPAMLFPAPADAPFPPLWLVGGLLATYLVLVLPVNYLVLRRLGRPGLMWGTVPALAVVFTVVTYLVGQGLHAGIRDQELQFLRAGPGGVLSRVDVHGLVFPTRGDHRISFGGDELVAPRSVEYPELAPSCLRCTFPPSAGSGTVEEHVIAGAGPVIQERGLIYGSVRVVTSATVGHGPFELESHLSVAGDRVRGTVVNRGKLTAHYLLVYLYSGGGYRGALLATSLPAGRSIDVDSALAQISDAPPLLPQGRRLNAAQRLSVVADETARLTLSHAGELAIVGFVQPTASHLAVDGVEPAGSVLAVFGMPAQIESASGRLGEVVHPRLAGSVADPTSGLLEDTYDLSFPAADGPLILRYDQRFYSEVQIYDWPSRSWRGGRFSQDPASPLVQLSRLDPGEVHDGLVRVRLSELNLSWGSAMTIRFPGESP